MKLTITKGKLVRIDGIPICKLVSIDGVPHLEFKDQDRMRSDCRGSCFVTIAVADFQDSLEKAYNEQDITDTAG